MKVIAINGSPRKNGNTSIVLGKMAEVLEESGIETEIVNVDTKVQGCISCFKCLESPETLCVLDNDEVNGVALRIRQADGILLGAPTYYGGMPGSMKAFLDRLFFPNLEMFANKISSAVAVHRRTGAEGTLKQLHNYLRVNHTIMAPQKYWLVVHGKDIGEVLQDEEGLQNVTENARSMAWLITMLSANKNTFLPPALEPRVFTSFIR